MPTATKTMTLSEYFRTLYDIKAPYVVVSGHTELPLQAPKTVIILTSQLKLLLQFNTFRHVTGNIYAFRLDDNENGNGKEATFILAPKGRGLFPERFESELLSHCEEHNGSVKIPEASLRAYVHLYTMLFRENLFRDDPERRLALTQMVTERVGPCMPCDLTLSK